MLDRLCLNSPVVLGLEFLTGMGGGGGGRSGGGGLGLVLFGEEEEKTFVAALLSARLFEALTVALAFVLNKVVLLEARVLLFAGGALLNKVWLLEALLLVELVEALLAKVLVFVIFVLDLSVFV